MFEPFTSRGSRESREHGRQDHPHCGERHRGRHRGFEGFFGRVERGFGPGAGERLFNNGELRIVILKLIAEKPSYGYEIIKAIEEKLSGGYAPSPGVVYPTLTLLEEEGLATVTSSEGNKKLFAATDRGVEYLKENEAMVKAIFERMGDAGRHFGRGRSPQVMRAMMNLGNALRMRMSRGNVTPEQVRKIVEAIDAAARAIDEV